MKPEVIAISSPNLECSFVCSDYFFAHAGIRPSVPIDQQQEEDFLWIRDDFLLNEHRYTKIAQLVQRDVQMILRRLPQLKPALAATYDGASPDAKAFLERLIAEIDPAFLDGHRQSQRPSP